MMQIGTKRSCYSSYKEAALVFFISKFYCCCYIFTDFCFKALLGDVVVWLLLPVLKALV